MPPPIQPPARVGDFRLISVLGEGSTGTIYEAEWGPRLVALKLLRAEHLIGGRRQRFFAEAERLRQIAHESVVKILSAGELPDGQPYLVMERLSGEPLAAALARGPLPVEAGLRLLDQIGGAVATLHAAGLVHRDIDASNVFLIDDGRHAVLLDMGMAGEAGGDGTTTRMSAAASATTAPERLLGGAATRASDLYELALLFFQAVTGRLPWDDPRDPRQRLAPRSPSELGVRLPPALEGRLMAALSPTPEQRPGSVGELVGGLRDAAASAAPSPPRSHRGLYALLALALVLAVGAGLAVYLLATRVDLIDADDAAPPMACDAGDAVACRKLADRYAFGDGVDHSFERAAELYRAACDHDDAEGCHMLGRMYRYGEGVEADRDLAVARYRQACELSGGRWGCREQANLTDDDARSVELLRLACDGGDPAGCTNLGIAYARGKGVGNDDVEAARLWRLACDGDDATGCSNLGLYYRHGTGVPKDPARAAELYGRACELSNGSSGCAGLGELYAAGVGVPKDDTRAAELFDRACKKRSAVGCHNGAVAYSSGRGVLQDKVQARLLYRKGCDLGHAPACNNLGSMLARGEGGDRDDDAAARLLDRACTGGNALGCSNLALLREAGRAGPKDVAAARTLREKACDLGHAPSCERVGRGD